MPFLILSNGLSQLARADGAPNVFNDEHDRRGNCQLYSRSAIYFCSSLGNGRSSMGNHYRTNGNSCCVLFYIPRFKQIHLEKHHYRMHFHYLKRIAAVGAANSLNQVTILFVQIVLNNLFKYYGAMSIYGANIPIAASGVAFKLNGLYISAVVGLGQGRNRSLALTMARDNMIGLNDVCF